MLTTTEQIFVAEAPKLPSSRSSSSSFPWQEAIRPGAQRKIADAPTEGTSSFLSIDEISTEAALVPTLALDVSSRFGLRLRELRQERNLTQLRMAREFGIDRSFISDVERGRKSISLPMLEVIALGMKVSLSELLRDL